ncbi:biotin/lipoyl-binding protein [Guyparkeria halophila]|uniref:Biotin/lipoyl-binding protein n=1 Tax=Guyparkeria halophila TaxID=47960 RepID=A0A6I6D5C8_9GAMM|nr:biotin/lipoyl-binding protein [Guyparkeria halophila]QGT78591.1 biotin/lipoyl-binding protein [Guyparkeria halophila]
MQPSDTPSDTRSDDSAPPSRPRRWLFRFLLPLLILGVAIVAFLALKASKPDAPQAQPEERAWLVETMIVEPATRHPVLTLYGEVANPDRLSINAPLSARVAAVPVEDGQSVTRGERLIELDSRDFQPALTRARANLADLEAQIREAQAQHESDRQALALEQEIVQNAETALSRSRDLRGRNLASQADVDNARDALSQARLALNTRRERLATFDARLAGLEARREAAKADVLAAERDLERARAEAPADGLVGNVEVTAGDQVAANATLLTFYPWDGFEARALIPSKRVASMLEALRAGDPPRARTRESGAALELERIAAEASGQGATGRFRYVEPDPSLRAGQVVTIELKMPAVDNAVAIPHSALYGNDHVYRIRDGRLERARVERLGEYRGDDATGEQGALLVRAPTLAAGDRLATTQLPNAVDGLKVRWEDEAASPGSPSTAGADE